jgi:cytochrome c-type biogenesis protein CcmH/NrfG
MFTVRISSLMLFLLSGLAFWTMAGCESMKDTPTHVLKSRADRDFEYQQWEPASKLYSEVVSREPHDGDAQYRYGVSLAMQGEFDKAESALQVASSLDPTDDRIFFALAETMFEKKQYQKLFTMLRDRAQDNRSIPTWIVLANYADKLGDFDTALEALTNACAIEDGSNSEPYYRAAQVLGRVGRTEEAVRRLRQAYGITPNDERISVMLVEYGEIPGPTIGLAPGR